MYSEKAKSLTGYGCVESKSLQAGEFFATGFLHAVTEDVLPGVQLQQLDAPQQLISLLQPLTGVLLPVGRDTLITWSQCGTSRSDEH